MSFLGDLGAKSQPVQNAIRLLLVGFAFLAVSACNQTSKVRIAGSTFTVDAPCATCDLLDLTAAETESLAYSFGAFSEKNGKSGPKWSITSPNLIPLPLGAIFRETKGSSPVLVDGGITLKAEAMALTETAVHGRFTGMLDFGYIALVLAPTEKASASVLRRLFNPVDHRAVQVPVNVHMVKPVVRYLPASLTAQLKARIIDSGNDPKDHRYAILDREILAQQVVYYIHKKIFKGSPIPKAWIDQAIENHALHDLGTHYSFSINATGRHQAGFGTSVFHGITAWGDTTAVSQPLIDDRTLRRAKRTTGLVDTAAGLDVWGR